MGMAYADFSKSSVRSALKRGLARQTLAQAEEAELPSIFRLTADLRPNRKAIERCAHRVQALPGMVRVAVGPAGIVAFVRNRRQMISRADAADLYTEEALFYTRISVRTGRHGTKFLISRASFSQHALERLVERSTVALDRSLLPAVDAEAVAILRQVAQKSLIKDGEDHYAPATQAGVWAGRVDLSDLEPDWGLTCPDATARIPVFSARTFLSPEEMRPTVWLRWKADPALSLT